MLNSPQHELKQLIIDKSNELGFQLCGFTDIGAIPEQQKRFEDWIGSGKHATMGWLEKRKSERGNVKQYFPDAKSLISFGLNYYHGNSEEVINQNYKISNYAWGHDYHQIIKDRLKLIVQLLIDTVPEAKSIVCVDTSPLMEKYWAQRAGLGWQGKHTNIITRDFGSWIFLGEILTSITFEPDAPFENDLCGSCTACLDACPTQALLPYILDSRKCISYLTIEHRGEINRQFDGRLDNWIYGCDVCQDVCPWNTKFSHQSKESAFAPRHSLISQSANALHSMDEEAFSLLFKNSPIKRTKLEGLKRNIRKNGLLED